MSRVRYAGFWIRWIADLIDSGLLTLPAWGADFLSRKVIYFFWAQWKLRQGVVLPGFDDAFNPLFLQAYELCVYFCFALPYYVWGQYRFGMTAGKWAVGWLAWLAGKYPVFKPIEVVRASDFGPITLRQAVIRFFSYGLSYAIFGTGFLMAAIHPEKRALHDLLSGTVSIRRPRRPNLKTEEPSAPRGT